MPYKVKKLGTAKILRSMGSAAILQLNQISRFPPSAFV